jgi:Transposase DDE domain group 1
MPGMILTGLDQLWVADITYLHLAEELGYLAIVLDAFSRKVVGWGPGDASTRGFGNRGARHGNAGSATTATCRSTYSAVAICWPPSCGARARMRRRVQWRRWRASVAHIRRRWPHVRILVRADSGFARDDLMAWCEANGVHFLFGLAKNDRLIAEIEGELVQAEAKSRRTGKPARYFRDFRWTTRRSWSRERRVVAITKNTSSYRFQHIKFRRSNP